MWWQYTTRGSKGSACVMGSIAAKNGTHNYLVIGEGLNSEGGLSVRI